MTTSPGWLVWTKYQGETEWTEELVPDQYRTSDSPTTFQHWWQLNLWFSQLEQDLKDTQLLAEGLQFFIGPLPAVGVSELDSNTTEQNYPATSTP